jgi:2-haloacid dehalogenase
MLVAVDPWDIDGAARASMTTAWTNRAASPYPAIFTPRADGHQLARAAEQLGSWAEQAK